MYKKLTPLLLLAVASATAWSRIIVDDSAPEPPPEKNTINVPGPGNSQEPSKPKEPAQDSLSFLNKDQLHGILAGIDQNGLRWQSAAAHDPITFRLDTVSQVQLDSHKVPAGAKSGQKVGLTNGDELPGNIVSLDDKTMVLDTWYAGRLTIPRPVLHRIVPLAPGIGPLYEGPTGMDGWNLGHMGNGRSWSFRDGAFVGSNYGTIGRDMKLPDLSELEFDLILRGNSQFSIALYSDRSDNFGNCYLLQLSNGYTEMQRYSRNGGSNDLGSTQLQNLMRREKTHVQIRTNKQKKTIWLMVDGRVAKEWTDPADFNGAGGSVVFACQPGTFVKLSNIRVSRWDGKFDDGSAPSDETKGDTVQLANQDKVSGHLESIRDGKARVTSAYAELNIPLDRVEQIDLAATHSNQPRQGAGDIRAYFPEGGSVTMQLDQWDAKGCSGASPNFGKATFSPDSFARILFNLPEQQSAGAEESSAEGTNTPEGVPSQE